MDQTLAPNSVGFDVLSEQERRIEGGDLGDKINGTRSRAFGSEDRSFCYLNAGSAMEWPCRSSKICSGLQMTDAFSIAVTGLKIEDTSLRLFWYRPTCSFEENSS